MGSWRLAAHELIRAGGVRAAAAAMARKIGGVLPAAEIEVRHGGQPFYRYLISAE